LKKVEKNFGKRLTRAGLSCYPVFRREIEKKTKESEAGSREGKKRERREGIDPPLRD